MARTMQRKQDVIVLIMSSSFWLYKPDGRRKMRFRQMSEPDNEETPRRYSRDGEVVKGLGSMTKSLREIAAD
jgi:hypothetical protein